MEKPTPCFAATSSFAIRASNVPAPLVFTKSSAWSYHIKQPCERDSPTEFCPLEAQQAYSGGQLQSKLIVPGVKSTTAALCMLHSALRMLLQCSDG